MVAMAIGALEVAVRTIVGISANSLNSLAAADQTAFQNSRNCLACGQYRADTRLEEKNTK
jgi:hypothetical protein